MIRLHGRLLAILFVAVSTAVNADNIDFTHVTIVDNATPFNADFDVSNIARNNANLPSTDGFGYASMSLAADTFVDFKFDQAYTFSKVTYIDRLHSGAAANVIGGTLDFVTQLDLIFSTNASYGDGDDQIVSVGPRAVPVGPDGIEDFSTDVAIPGISAQYMRFDVIANNGANPGAHTFVFDGVAVPEPSSTGLILLGLVGLHRWIRRR